MSMRCQLEAMLLGNARAAALVAGSQSTSFSRAKQMFEGQNMLWNGYNNPKQLAVALPANLRCGAPDVGRELPPEPAWAPLTLTYAGIWEVEPGWLEEHADEVTLLDVRPGNEFHGALGHIAGSLMIPIGELASRVDELAKDRPVVTICRAGGRSAQATVLLGRAGIWLPVWM